MFASLLLFTASKKVTGCTGESHIALLSLGPLAHVLCDSQSGEVCHEGWFETKITICPVFWNNTKELPANLLFFFLYIYSSILWAWLNQIWFRCLLWSDWITRGVSDKGPSRRLRSQTDKGETVLLCMLHYTALNTLPCPSLLALKCMAWFFMHCTKHHRTPSKIKHKNLIKFGQHSTWGKMLFTLLSK